MNQRDDIVSNPMLASASPLYISEVVQVFRCLHFSPVKRPSSLIVHQNRKHHQISHGSLSPFSFSSRITHHFRGLSKQKGTRAAQKGKSR